MYQTMSPENMGSSSVKKSNTTTFKSSREDHQNNQNGGENGRIATTNGNVTPALTATATATTTTTSTSLEGNRVIHKSPPNTNENSHRSAASSSSAVHESSPSRSNVCLVGGGGSGGDMLLQWGQNKRSRCSRTEGRSMVNVVLEKHHPNNSNHVMAPPPPHPNLNPVHPSLPSISASNGCRSGGSTRARAHGLLYKDTPFSTKNRNLVDQMGTHSASPSRNGSGSSRSISRSTVGKRSPSCNEKNDKKLSSSGAIRKVKSDDSLAPLTSNGNHHVELAHVDHEHGGGGGGGGAASMARSPVADTEKGVNEVVEWPRIYLSLSRKEKEDDFYAMKGTKLPHRPKKRAKAVDRALQYCFPGLWLSDLTRARYEVRERKSAKKPKRRGLKGLETIESESE